MHEVQLLLDVVGVERPRDARRHHDRVDAERGHLQALADLAEPGTLAEVLEPADCVAVPPLHARIFGGSLHVRSFCSVDCQWRRGGNC